MSIACFYWKNSPTVSLFSIFEKYILTMKTIYIARHAKSSWEDISASDHDRDLLEIGIQRTLKVGIPEKVRCYSRNHH